MEKRQAKSPNRAKIDDVWEIASNSYYLKTGRVSPTLHHVIITRRAFTKAPVVPHAHVILHMNSIRPSASNEPGISNFIRLSDCSSVPPSLGTSGIQGLCPEAKTGRGG